MKQLSSKIFIGYLTVILVLSSLIFIFSYQTIKTHFLETSVDELKTVGAIIKINIIPILTHKENKDLDSLIKIIGKRVNTRITIIDMKGNVLSDSKEDYRKMENHADRPEVRPAFKGLLGQSLRFSNTINKEMLYVAIPIFDNTRQIAICRLSYFVSDIDTLLLKVRKDMIEISLLVLLLTLIGVLVFAKNVSKPLNQLSFAARKVASGDFDIKVKIQGNDEISELSENFNNMARKLKKLFEKTNSQREKLNALITNVQEGIAVINIKDEVTLSNQSFQSVFKKNLVPKQKVRTLENDEFLKIYYEIKTKKGRISKELEIDENYFLCSGTFIDTKEEIIIVLYNITELRKLEIIKKDLVTNVSHELRTPLTAIKGFIETINEETSGEIQHYSDIILRHTNRLIYIVNDLLILSELENAQNKIIKTNVNLAVLVENIVKIFETKLKEKNLKLFIDIPSELPNLSGDTFKLEQMLINLIDNAIKYTDDGYIEMKAFVQDSKIIIDIKDTGIGIPIKDRERIFERFYIVDKSRSRKVGGTGLGLSIVKHIVQLHNGDIKIDPNQAKGTKFIISFPLDIA